MIFLWLVIKFPSTNIDNLGGQGVMLYVKEGISAVHKKELENDNIEILWVELKFQNRLIYFGVCYRPPGMSALEVDDFGQIRNYTPSCSWDDEADCQKNVVC